MSDLIKHLRDPARDAELRKGVHDGDKAKILDWYFTARSQAPARLPAIEAAMSRLGMQIPHKGDSPAPGPIPPSKLVPKGDKWPLFRDEDGPDRILRGDADAWLDEGYRMAASGHGTEAVIAAFGARYKKLRRTPPQIAGTEAA